MLVARRELFGRLATRSQSGSVAHATQVFVAKACQNMETVASGTSGHVRRLHVLRTVADLEMVEGGDNFFFLSSSSSSSYFLLKKLRRGGSTGAP